MAGGLDKQVHVSHELEEIVGKSKLKRSDILKLVWKYIKENDCQDGRNIIPDTLLSKVIGTKKITMFELMGKLNKHISA